MLKSGEKVEILIKRMEPTKLGVHSVCIEVYIDNKRVEYMVVCGSELNEAPQVYTQWLREEE